MTCPFPHCTLALHVEGDLPASAATVAAQHLERCSECREFFDELRDRQSLLKTLRLETAIADDDSSVRQRVMSTITERDQLGWTLRIERALMQAFWRPSYALATFAVLGIVSASVLAQMRQAPAPGGPASVAVFERTVTLLKPRDYREWILLGESPAHDTTAAKGTVDRPGAHRVYSDPNGHRAFATTGAFAEGTVMIWERARGASDRDSHPHGQALLLASVKDSARFENGWGFFDFTGGLGRLEAAAEPAPASKGCRTCHLEEADTDSVFTQFYAELRPARQHS